MFRPYSDNLECVVLVKFPRDTSKQINSKFLSIEVYLLEILFLKNNIVNHVGIYINDNCFLHSSGQLK